MTKYKHLITIKEYVESEGLTLDSYWLRRLGQITLKHYLWKQGTTLYAKKPPTINRKGFKGKGYDPVVDKEVLAESLTQLMRLMDTKTKYDALYSRLSQPLVTQ